MLQVEDSVPTGLLSNSNGKHTSRSGHVVEEIRKRFFEEEWEHHKELYEEIDVERMRNSEWYVKRYLLAARRNTEEAYQMLKTTLAWRKTVGISTTPINVFPEEFFKIGGLFQYEPDRKGNPVLFMRIRMHRKVIELQEPIQQFLFYMINKMDSESDGNGIVILFDCSSAGYANMDLDMLKTLSEVAFKYFPFSIKYVIVYELSWVLSAFRRLAMTVIPSTLANIVYFATKDDITNFIAPENLPDFMGGTCERDYRTVPEGCPRVDSVALERGYSLEDVERIKAIFKPYLDEAEAAIAAKKEKDKKSKENQGQTIETHKIIEITEQTEGEEATTGPVAIIRAQAKTFEAYASLYPQNAILFRYISIHTTKWPADKQEDEASKVLRGTLLLRNNHQQKALAFKVQSTHSELFSVTPNQGVILSGAFVSIIITVKSTRELQQLDKQKFMILLCPDVKPERDLVNTHRFSRLFIERGEQVFSHKLQARIEEKRTQDGDAPGKKTGKLAQLEKEISQLQRKCSQLKVRQTWFNIFLVLLTCLALIFLALPLRGDHQSRWANILELLFDSSQRLGTTSHQEL